MKTFISILCLAIIAVMMLAGVASAQETPPVNIVVPPGRSPLENEVHDQIISALSDYTQLFTIVVANDHSWNVVARVNCLSITIESKPVGYSCSLYAYYEDEWSVQHGLVLDIHAGSTSSIAKAIVVDLLGYASPNQVKTARQTVDAIEQDIVNHSVRHEVKPKS